MRLTGCTESADLGTRIFAQVPTLKCGRGCSVRDVWGRKDLSIASALLPMTLRSHQSGFYILDPASNDADDGVAVADA